MKSVLITILSFLSVNAYATHAADVIACEFMKNGDNYYANGANVFNTETQLVNYSPWNYVDKVAFGTCASINKSEDGMSADVILTRYSFEVSFSDWKNVEYDHQCNPIGDFENTIIESQAFTMNAGDKWLDYYLYKGNPSSEKFGFYLARPSEYKKLYEDGGSNSLCNFLVGD